MDPPPFTDYSEANRSSGFSPRVKYDHDNPFKIFHACTLICIPDDVYTQWTSISPPICATPTNMGHATPMDFITHPVLRDLHDRVNHGLDLMQPNPLDFNLSPLHYLIDAIIRSSYNFYSTFCCSQGRHPDSSQESSQYDDLAPSFISTTELLNFFTVLRYQYNVNFKVVLTAFDHNNILHFIFLLLLLLDANDANISPIHAHSSTSCPCELHMCHGFDPHGESTLTPDYSPTRNIAAPRPLVFTPYAILSNETYNQLSSISLGKIPLFTRIITAICTHINTLTHGALLFQENRINLIPITILAQIPFLDRYYTLFQTIYGLYLARLDELSDETARYFDHDTSSSASSSTTFRRRRSSYGVLQSPHHKPGLKEVPESITSNPDPDAASLSSVRQDDGQFGPEQSQNSSLESGQPSQNEHRPAAEVLYSPTHLSSKHPIHGTPVESSTDRRFTHYFRQMLLLLLQYQGNLRCLLYLFDVWFAFPQYCALFVVFNYFLSHLYHDNMQIYSMPSYHQDGSLLSHTSGDHDHECFHETLLVMFDQIMLRFSTFHLMSYRDKDGNTLLHHFCAHPAINMNNTHPTSFPNIDHAFNEIDLLHNASNDALHQGRHIPALTIMLEKLLDVYQLDPVAKNHYGIIPLMYLVCRPFTSPLCIVLIKWMHQHMQHYHYPYGLFHPLHFYETVGYGRSTPSQSSSTSPTDIPQESDDDHRNTTNTDSMLTNTANTLRPPFTSSFPFNMVTSSRMTPQMYTKQIYDKYCCCTPLTLIMDHERNTVFHWLFLFKIAYSFSSSARQYDQLHTQFQYLQQHQQYQHYQQQQFFLYYRHYGRHDCLAHQHQSDTILDDSNQPYFDVVESKVNLNPSKMYPRISPGWSNVPFSIADLPNTFGETDLPKHGRHHSLRYFMPVRHSEQRAFGYGIGSAHYYYHHAQSHPSLFSVGTPTNCNHDPCHAPQYRKTDHILSHLNTLIHSGVNYSLNSCDHCSPLKQDYRRNHHIPGGSMETSPTDLMIQSTEYVPCISYLTESYAFVFTKELLSTSGLTMANHLMYNLLSSDAVYNYFANNHFYCAGPPAYFMADMIQTPPLSSNGRQHTTTTRHERHEHGCDCRRRLREQEADSALYPKHLRIGYIYHHTTTTDLENYHLIEDIFAGSDHNKNNMILSVEYANANYHRQSFLDSQPTKHPSASVPSIEGLSQQCTGPDIGDPDSDMIAPNPCVDVKNHPSTLPPETTLHENMSTNSFKKLSHIYPDDHHHIEEKKDQVESLPLFQDSPGQRVGAHENSVETLQKTSQTHHSPRPSLWFSDLLQKQPPSFAETILRRDPFTTYYRGSHQTSDSSPSISSLDSDRYPLDPTLDTSTLIDLTWAYPALSPTSFLDFYSNYDTYDVIVSPLALTRGSSIYHQKNSSSNTPLHMFCLRPQPYLSSTLLIQSNLQVISHRKNAPQFCWRSRHEEHFHSVTLQDTTTTAGYHMINQQLDDVDIYLPSTQKAHCYRFGYYLTNFKLLSLLLRHYSPIDQPNNNGCSPVMLLSPQQHHIATLVVLLRQYGADLTNVNVKHYKRTVFHHMFCTTYNTANLLHYSCYRLLSTLLYSQLNQQNSNGYTPLDYLLNLQVLPNISTHAPRGFSNRQIPGHTSYNHYSVTDTRLVQRTNSPITFLTASPQDPFSQNLELNDHCQGELSPSSYNDLVEYDDYFQIVVDLIKRGGIINVLNRPYFNLLYTIAKTHLPLTQMLINYWFIHRHPDRHVLYPNLPPAIAPGQNSSSNPGQPQQRMLPSFTGALQNTSSQAIPRLTLSASMQSLSISTRASNDNSTSPCSIIRSSPAKTYASNGMDSAHTPTLETAAQRLGITSLIEMGFMITDSVKIPHVVTRDNYIPSECSTPVDDTDRVSCSSDQVDQSISILNRGYLQSLYYQSTLHLWCKKWITRHANSALQYKPSLSAYLAKLPPSQRTLLTVCSTTHPHATQKALQVVDQLQTMLTQSPDGAMVPLTVPDHFSTLSACLSRDTPVNLLDQEVLWLLHSDAKLDINVKDYQGKTPLHLLVEYYFRYHIKVGEAIQIILETNPQHDFNEGSYEALTKEQLNALRAIPNTSDEVITYIRLLLHHGAIIDHPLVCAVNESVERIVNNDAVYHLISPEDRDDQVHGTGDHIGNFADQLGQKNVAPTGTPSTRQSTPQCTDSRDDVVVSSSLESNIPGSISHPMISGYKYNYTILRAQELVALLCVTNNCAKTSVRL